MSFELLQPEGQILGIRTCPDRKSTKDFSELAGSGPIPKKISFRKCPGSGLKQFW